MTDTRDDETRAEGGDSAPGDGGKGDPRRSDRRRGDRRALERRAPPPVWRRPWALVAYGVLGTLVVVLLLNRSRPAAEAPPVASEEIRTTPGRAPAQDPDPGVAAAPVQDARTAASYERLMAEGEAALGQRVSVELFCESIRSIALRGVERIESPVAALADANARVPAAECKWGQRTDATREDFLLLVPPRLADSFANAPGVQDGFVQRKHVRAEVEWLGRSDALHLRTAGVLLEVQR